MSGETHKRQRKVVQPAFGAGETKALLPVFRGCVERVSSPPFTSLSRGRTKRIPGDIQMERHPDRNL